MRLFLDTLVAGSKIAKALRKAGYNVEAMNESVGLKELDYEDLLERALREQRVFVTANAAGFSLALRQWHSIKERPHAGCIVLTSSLRFKHYSVIVAYLEGLLDGSSQKDWGNRVESL